MLEFLSSTILVEKHQKDLTNYFVKSKSKQLRFSDLSYRGHMKSGISAATKILLLIGYLYHPRRNHSVAPIFRFQQCTA